MSNDDFVVGFSEFSTGLIADALLRLGLFRHSPGIHPVAGNVKVLGRAFTVLYRSQSVVNPGTVGDYIDDVAPGQVIVLDNRGREDCTVWGDILTLAAGQRKVAGTVIDGVCRDTARAGAMAYPLYARGSTMRTGKGRVEVASINVPVSVGEAQVAPGDLVVGDQDGICIVPWQRAEEVLHTAQLIDEAERTIEKMLGDGSSLAAARARTGYFSLQESPGGNEPSASTDLRTPS